MKQSVGSSRVLSDDNGGSDAQDELMQSFIRAVTRDMKETLRMAPGGEFTEESIEFMKQSAQLVIQQQCELLYDLSKQIHKEICGEIVSEVDRLNARFKQDLNWEQFSADLGDLMERSVDALNANKGS